MKKVVLFLAIVSFSSVAGITDITTKPVALIALKKNSAQYVDVCKAADDSCKEGTSIWKEKNADGIFYLTTSHLQLGPPKLGMSFATGGVLIVHAKNTGFIAVQRQRFTMLINIMTCGFKVRKRGFRFDEQKLHDFTGCVINVDQCGAGWSSAFKPVMIAAIDLYQFARTRTPVTWLRDPCGAELQADITIEPLQR